MGDKIELTVEQRNVSGKAVKALRKQGFIPAVIYGNEYEPRSVMAPQPTMLRAYRSAGKHHPVELQLDGKKHLAMIKTADIDPVKHTLRHLAFQAIKQNETVETEVPIVITGTGETPAEKAGLVVLTTIDTAEIEALPANLPDALEAPGERLVGIGDRLTIADLLLPKGVTLLSDLDQVVATVYEPSALAAQNEALAGEAEPEAAEELPADHGEEATEDENTAKPEE